VVLVSEVLLLGCALWICGLVQCVNRFLFCVGCEGIQLSEVTLDTILQASNGDMRKAVTFLQSAHQLSGGQARIPPEIVVDISGQVHSLFDHFQLRIVSSISTWIDNRWKFSLSGWWLFI
jgi:replication factor C subunit 2/4